METADRPGLLVDLVKIVTDISVAVESGEFDTEVSNCSPATLIDKLYGDSENVLSKFAHEFNIPL